MVSLENLQLPPHNIEAEKWVICWVLLDNELMHIYDWLSVGHFDFYQKEHQYVYEAIKTLQTKHKTIDVVTLSDELWKMKVLDEIGWTEYLYDLNTFLLTTSPCGEYAQLVKEKSILRWILKVCQKITWDVYDQKDTTEILDSIEKRIFDLTQVNMSDRLVHVKEILEKRVEDYMEIVDNPELLDQRKVLSTYKKLDDMLGWFKQWELFILAARPAMGKTSLAINLLLNIAIDQHKSVAFFSLEMTSQSIVDRLLSTVASIPMNKITKWNLTNDDFHKMWEAVSVLGESNIFVDDSGSLTIPELKSKLRRLKIEKWKLDFVVIDYLQLMSWAWWKYDGNRVQEISQISRWLKEMSKELAVPIMALSQLSRNVEQRIDKKPQLSDLRESWAIEQDADAVLMIHREEYYDPDTDKKWVTDILIRKNRNGPTWEVELMFQKTTMKFESYEWGWESDHDIF